MQTNYHFKNKILNKNFFVLLDQNEIIKISISDLEEFNFKGVKKFQTHQEKVFKEKVLKRYDIL